MATAVDQLAKAGRPPEREDVDYRLNHFVLDPTGARKVDIADAVTDTSLTLTIEGASTLELTVYDPDLRLLKGNLLTEWAWGANADDRDEKHWIKDGRAIDAQLDDLWFRLVKVSKESADTLRLVFEDRLVSMLRAHRGARKMYRDSGVTRAEFVAALARAAGLTPDEIYIPELHRRIPIAKPAEKVGVTERRRKGHKGITRHLHGITVKGVKATPTQIDILQRASDTAEKLNAPKAAVLAMYCAAIAESTVSFAVNSSGYGGPWQTRQVDPHDVERMAWHFLKGGKGFQAGGAIHQARIGTSPGQIANVVEAGGAGASFYGQYLDEAHKIYDAFYAGTQLIGGSTNVEITAAKPYAFARGKHENSWDAIQRLAEEIGFRAFIRKGVFWYASEEFLFNQAPQLDIVEGDDGIDELLFDIDVGSRDLVNELTLTASAARWTVLPGMVGMVHKQGAADGRWLVHQVERPLHDPQAAVTLNKSIPLKPEPAPETETTSFTLTGRDVGGKVNRQNVGKMSPKQLIDNIVLPVARHDGIHVTAASVAAANARHGPTVTGGRSDHQGPPSYAWAADMSNGSGPTPQMNKLARDLAEMFGLSWNGAGVTERTAFGFRFQMLYKTTVGGNHFNHVHFGCRKA